MRVWEISKTSRGRSRAAVRIPFRAIGARRASCSRTTAATSTAAATTRACPTSSATRSRPATSTRCRTPSQASFGRCRSSDGRLVVLTYTGDGFVPAIIEPAPDQGCERDHVPGRRGRREVPRRHDVAGAAAEHRRRGEADHRQGVPTTRCGTCARECLPRAAGLQGLGRASAITFNIEDPLGFAKVGITAAYTPDGDLPDDERGHVEITGELPRLAGDALVEPLGLLRPLRTDEAQPQGLRRQARLRPTLLIYDDPRRLRAKFDLALLRQDRHAAERAERADELQHQAIHRFHARRQCDLSGWPL